MSLSAKEPAIPTEQTDRDEQHLQGHVAIEAGPPEQDQKEDGVGHAGRPVPRVLPDGEPHRQGAGHESGNLDRVGSSAAYITLGPPEGGRFDGQPIIARSCRGPGHFATSRSARCSRGWPRRCLTATRSSTATPARAGPFARSTTKPVSIARGLIARGVKPGDRVAVWATNVPEWIVLQFALAKIGAILVTVNTALRAHEIEYLLRQSETSTLVTIAGFRGVDYLDELRSIGVIGGDRRQRRGAAAASGTRRRSSAATVLTISSRTMISASARRRCTVRAISTRSRPPSASTM